MMSSRHDRLAPACMSMTNEAIIPTSRGPASTSTSSHVTVVWPQMMIGPAPIIVKLESKSSGDNTNLEAQTTLGNPVATQTKATESTRANEQQSNIITKYVMMKQVVKTQSSHVNNPSDLIKADSRSSFVTEFNNDLVVAEKHQRTINTDTYTNIVPKMSPGMPLDSGLISKQATIDQSLHLDTVPMISLSSGNLPVSDNGLLYSTGEHNGINVTVESINPPLGEFQAEGSQFRAGDDAIGGVDEHSEGFDVIQAELIPDIPDGYGPECIIGETEVVVDDEAGTMTAAEEMFVSLEMTLDEVDVDESDDMVLSNVAMAASSRNLHVEGPGSRLDIVQLPGDNTKVETQLSVPDCGDNELVVSALNSYKVHAQANPNQEWMKQEWKKATDRAKKRSKRADPAYRLKEREEAQKRMRSRRMDPEYREKERNRDRERRKCARKQNTAQRLDERERDKTYRRLRRTSYMPDPHIVLTIDEMTHGQFVNADDVIVHGVPELELDGKEAILGTHDLEFQVDNDSVIPTSVPDYDYR